MHILSTIGIVMAGGIIAVDRLVRELPHPLAVVLYTIAMILLTEDSWSSRVTFAATTPSIATKPASTLSPGCTVLGTLSPVRADVSISDMPLSTCASSGTRSPGRIRI